MRKSFLEIDWEIPRSFERIADISTAAREPSSDRGALCITVTVLLLKRRSKAKRVIRPYHLRFVLEKAALLLALGLVFGLVASWFATRAIQAFLFGVDRHDPITILSVCALLAVCGLIAAIIPARRAASIDPMQALRTE